jgi:hypothetical protein
MFLMKKYPLAKRITTIKITTPHPMPQPMSHFFVELLDLV